MTASSSKLLRLLARNSEDQRVIFKPIPEATTRVASLQTQEADIIVIVPLTYRN
jgi:hypothetical protein